MKEWKYFEHEQCQKCGNDLEGMDEFYYLMIGVMVGVGIIFIAYIIV